MKRKQKKVYARRQKEWGAACEQKVCVSVSKLECKQAGSTRHENRFSSIGSGYGVKVICKMFLQTTRAKLVQ